MYRSIEDFKIYLVFWLLGILAALTIAFIFQGQLLDLYVYDQFYYFDQLNKPYFKMLQDIGPRYILFMTYLKILNFLTPDPLIIFFIYVFINGIILTLLCRKYNLLTLFFFLISYIYLSHGLYRDQLILSLVPLIGRLKFISEFLIIALRFQLILLLEYRLKILNFIIPTLLVVIAISYAEYSTVRDVIQINFSIFTRFLQNYSSLVGYGFFFSEINLPLSFIFLRILLGNFILILLFIELYNFKSKYVWLYKYFLYSLLHSILQVNMDIRVHIIIISIILITSNFKKIN